jgi:hypothetical protein
MDALPLRRADRCLYVLTTPPVGSVALMIGLIDL